MTDQGFSVLLPVYHGDRPEFLRRAFDSVTRDQLLAPSEVVVVQDGPVGPELAAELEGLGARSAVPVVHVTLAENRGLAAALEAGLERCAWDVVARMDADDISLPERFAAQVPLVHAGADVVGSWIAEFEGDERRRGEERRVPADAAGIARRARTTSPFQHPSVVYRRSAVRAAGGYQHIDRMEDYWLWVRMLRAGAVAANVPEVLVLYRVGAGAFQRRGGWSMARSEVSLQRRMHEIGFTSRGRYLVNTVVRGTYRLVPVGVRRRVYRRVPRD